MFKRPRLSAQTFPVNAGLAGFLLFYAVSCSGPQEPEETSQAANEPPPQEEAQPPADTANSLPAVWMTRQLDFPVRSIGITGGAGSNFAVAYEGGGLQIFNFDGERITEISDHDVEELAEGRYAMISGTPVTLFPGIDSSGDLKVWIHGGGLTKAIEYDLQGAGDSPIGGLCAAPPEGNSGDALHRLSFWTQTSPNLLQVGSIIQDGDALVWTGTETVETDDPVSACVYTQDGPEVFAEPIITASRLRRLGRQTTLTLKTNGDVTAIYGPDSSQAFDISDGITVVAPTLPNTMASTGDARGGGYPGGIIVLGGDIGPDDHRAVLVDPSKITLTPISVPPAQP